MKRNQHLSAYNLSKHDSFSHPQTMVTEELNF